MDNTFGIFSLLFFGCGVYAIYAWVKMKKDGHINETLLLGKNYFEYACKDKEAFIKKAQPAVLTFGIVSVVYGVIDFVHYYVTPIQILDYIAMAAFFVCIVWFMVYTTRLKREYF